MTERDEARAAQTKVGRGMIGAAKGCRHDTARANRTTTGWSAIFGNSTSDMLAQAQAAFSEVLRRDPQIPSALIGLAAHHLVLVEDSYVADSGRYLAEAERLLDGALKRVPEASPPITTSASFTGIVARCSPRSRPSRTAPRSIRVSRPAIHMGSVLTRLGRMEEALQQIHYAMRISPKDPISRSGPGCRHGRTRERTRWRGARMVRARPRAQSAQRGGPCPARRHLCTRRRCCQGGTVCGEVQAAQRSFPIRSDWRYSARRRNGLKSRIDCLTGSGSPSRCRNNHRGVLAAHHARSVVQGFGGHATVGEAAGQPRAHWNLRSQPVG
jgi:hypothetical protein